MTEIHFMQREAEKIARQWLDELAFSAATWDLRAHMGLVSHQVEVTGIPNVESIGYTGWKVRRKNEFEKKLLHSLSYRLHDILSKEDGQLRFTVEETMRAFNGKVVIINKEITLQREGDGKWRVRREHFERIRTR
ncbi:MAG: hypothetical protein OQK94_12625 [Gammaproteobacteria bacterium]|nr:hypothetical protein [Gammaproteobacteria bacterium]MCW8841431.1 hypothetical protein [Gammaproteobacteria bacterium]MCW8927333.1 hypothetical protein [Gammaproteobacteria bacterium]MCW8957678.1 hypothetical protein [Gammaproteobacteria bacterium]MCW8971729.1 hypothetical protein [Gammaproteobacteria bacterium]